MLNAADYPLITADSRQVVPGALYVAVPGSKSDGHNFVVAAVAAGAAAIVAERPVEVPAGVKLELVADSRAALTGLIRDFYRRPDLGLKFFGVTGTNGKTTTAMLVEQLLRRAEHRGMLISTVEYRTPEWSAPASHTTPGPEEFFKLLRRGADEGAKFVSMELSSHALDQNRTGGVRFDAAVFTNLTGDHLDYHRTMEAYYDAKRRLFIELLAPGATAVINIDDPWGRKLAGEVTDHRVVTFGESDDCDCRIVKFELKNDGTTFVLRRSDGEFTVKTPLIGEHNVFNLTGALLAAEALGAKWPMLLAAAAEVTPAPGRLELFMRADGAGFVVDYAHTDDALVKVLAALRPLTRGKLITVFGCGGDRDRTKRPRMGKAAAAASDYLVVTSDNPRSEEPEAIIAEILPGIPAGVPHRVEPDRGAAIKFSVELAKSGDTVLVAGKGHEDYQEIKGVKRHFSDREEIERLIG